ncbi:MAG: hypothetical protein ABI885_29990 [Gammaproteobacteria bacterium]
MDANASDGSAFSFGSSVNTNADANELNDTVTLATTIPDGRAVKSGNMDSAQDVDYFQYVPQNGQNVLMNLSDTFGLNEWVFQYFNGSAWAALSANQFYTLSGLVAGSPVYVRILPNASAVLNPAHAYGLTVGTQVMSSNNVSVSTTENLVRINTTPFLTTQAHNLLNWSIHLLDSNGNPVQGVTTTFRWQWDSSTSVQVSSAVSNSAGVASGQANLGNCSGPNTIVQTSAGQTWRTVYDTGHWDIKVTGADPTQVGVGGANFPSVTLGHICQQTLQ